MLSSRTAGVVIYKTWEHVILERCFLCLLSCLLMERMVWLRAFLWCIKNSFLCKLYAWMPDSYPSTVDHYWSSLTRDTPNLEFFSSYLFDFSFVSVLSLVLLSWRPLMFLVVSFSELFIKKKERKKKREITYCVWILMKATILHSNPVQSMCQHDWLVLGQDVLCSVICVVYACG